MGFQPDTGAVGVKATLTDLGTKYLLTEPNKFVIEKFSAYDDEVDYTLWNTTHPNGTDYYGYAIEQLPLLEPITTSAYQLKYALHRDYERDTARMGSWEVLGAGETTVELQSMSDVYNLGLRLWNVSGGTVKIELGNDTVASVVNKHGQMTKDDKSGYAVDNTTIAGGFIDPGCYYTQMNGDKLELEITAKLNANAVDSRTTMMTITEMSNNVRINILLLMKPNTKLNLNPTKFDGTSS